MLYPLSYEGASGQFTCQRVLARTRAYQPLPTCLTCSCSDPRSRSGAHRSLADRARANRCPALPTAASQRQRLTEQISSTWRTGSKGLCCPSMPPATDQLS
jgi:hypothetical protein